MYPNMNSPAPTKTYAQLIEQGLQASASGDSTEAVALFAQAASMDTSVGAPHFLMGSEFAANGEFDKAEECFVAALLVQPQLSIVRYQLGLLQFTSARIAAAAMTWQPLLQDLPDTHYLHQFVAGYLALANEDIPKALSHFDTGLSKNTENAPLSNDIRLVVTGLQQLGKHTSEETSPASAASEDAQSEHIFFANYQRQGSLH